MYELTKFLVHPLTLLQKKKNDRNGISENENQIDCNTNEEFINFIFYIFKYTNRMV